MKEFEEKELFDFDDEEMVEDVCAGQELAKDEEPLELTAVEALEQIMHTVCLSGLQNKDWEKVKRECDYLSSLYGFSPFQSLMVAFMLNVDGEVTLAWMASSMNCSQLYILRYASEADELVNQRLVSKNYQKHNGEHKYKLSRGLSNAILQNRSYVPKKLSELNKEEVFSHINQLISDYKYHDDEETRKAIVDKIRRLYAGCSHLSVCATIDGLKLDDNDLLVLSIVGESYVLDGRTEYYDTFWIGVWSNIEDNEASCALRHGTSELIKQGYLACSKDFEDEICYNLTDKAKLELFKQYKPTAQGTVAEEPKVNTNHPIILPDSIGAKPLFYNPSESELVQRLSDLLGQEQFRGVQERLKESGLRQGFACLFYGDPGTGKTETVLQLARQTGRSIMRVDMSKVRDKYNGESEKAVQAIFDQYHQLVLNRKSTPILLLNEADALLSQRTENTRDWSDKMENAIQNILLQAMESFEGILMATTNLSGSLDSAFERRFLYKIKFTKPCQEVKEKIWHAMLPDLGADETRELAKNYDFSGGQIENVKRKQVVDYLLYGKTTGYDHIVQLCKEEKLVKNNSMSIGFR